MANSPPSISLLYGPTGSPTLSSRFAIEGQPFAAVPISVGGTVSDRPAHALGLQGAAYRYGGTVVNGAKNILPLTSAWVNLPPYARNFGAASFDLGKAAGTNSPFHVPMQTYNTRYPYLSPVTMLCDGEIIGSAAPGGTESFTTAGTVAITQGNATIVGSGTSWTTNALAFSYPYTAANNAIYPGDIIQVTHSTGTVYYRIQTITDNTHLVVFPTPAETSESGRAYAILRSGYGSYSRVVTLGDNPTTYYAGLLYARTGAGFGYPVYTGIRPSIMAYDATISPVHRMGPTGVYASDIAYYKSYLIYGYGSSIGWTVPGFPTTSPFASADFPASSLTVVSTVQADVFVAFEYLGDQLIAVFTKSLWVVQQNPGQTQAAAFSFYKLPEVTGSVVPLGNGVTTVDPTGQLGANCLPSFRPSCSADGAIYYLAISGLMELTNVNSRAVSVSADIDDILPHGATIHYDAVSDSIIVEQFGDPMYVYNRQSQQWSIATWYNCFGPSDNLSTRRTIPRMLRWTHYDGTSILGQEAEQTTTNFDRPAANPTDAWSWASPIVNLSDIYTDFVTSGIRIDCEGPGLSTANVTWTIYGGPSQYAMAVQKTGTYNAAAGTTSGRNLIDVKVDFPFVAVTLSGATRIKFNQPGIWLYQMNRKATR